MPLLHETLETALPIGDAFAFVADFANAPIWDPGTVASVRMDAGPIDVGARYRLEVRIGGRTAPMEYRIVALEPTRRVVLAGEGSNVEARDEIAFTPLPDGGTRVDYQAEIRLGGWLRLIEPFAGGAFRKLGRDAGAGLQQALDERARLRAVAR